MSENRILAIDPSINDIGWCFGGDDGTMQYGTIHSKGKTEEEKLIFISKAVNDLIREYQPTDAIIEKASFFNYARHKGLKISNSLRKLHMSFGIILSVFSIAGINTETPLPEEYKPKYNRGRMIICMSYRDIRQILDAQFRNLRCNEHEAHAIYMMLWKKHRMKLESMRVGE
jgi:hypothetical protein